MLRVLRCGSAAPTSTRPAFRVRAACPGRPSGGVSGRRHGAQACTVNVQRGLPASSHTSIAIVELAEQEGLRLDVQRRRLCARTRYTSVSASRSGSCTATTIYYPVFVPADAGLIADAVASSTHAVISGLGQSAVGRRLGRSALDLTTQACLAAIADAGLRPSDIDGICTYPGGDAVETAGYGGPPPAAVQDALRLNLNWYAGSGEVPGQLGSVVSAAMAIATGMCRHVLVYRTVTESTMQGARGRGALLPGAARRSNRHQLLDGPVRCGVGGQLAGAGR